MESMLNLSKGVEGKKKVRELAERSMTASQLLEFCCTTLRDKMDKFDAKKTTTNDVVRSVIIPVTYEESTLESSSPGSSICVHAS